MTTLNEWVESVINRDEKCVICNSRKDLEAHHVFHVNPHDKIYYATNNGVCLCKKCHDKYHELYGVDCNIKNLLALQRKIGDSRVKKLKKKNKRLRKVVKNMQKIVGDSE